MSNVSSHFGLAPNEPMNWTVFKQFLPIQPEAESNPGLGMEQADRFSSVSKDSTEIEFLDFLYGLIRATGVHRLLETGTGKGISAVALAFALIESARSAATGPFSLTSVESDLRAASEAKELVERAGLGDFVAIRHSDSVRFIESFEGTDRFDFVYFDSSRRTRVREFELLKARGLIDRETILAFHDTSLRWNTPEAPQYVKQYLLDLQNVRAEARESFSLPLSRGLSIFKL